MTDNFMYNLYQINYFKKFIELIIKKMYELFKITQYIYLDSLDEIKQSLIKKDKILSS